MPASARTVTVTVQLVGVNGLRAVPPEDGASYTIVKEAFSQIDGTATPSSPLTQRSTDTVAVDDTGKIEFILDGVDPESNDTGDTAADEILWRYTVTPVGDSPPFDEPVENVEVVFTDAESGGDHNRPGHPGQVPAGGEVELAAGQQCGDRYCHRSVRPAVQGCHAWSSQATPTPVFFSRYSGTCDAQARRGQPGSPTQHSGTGGTRETLTARVRRGRHRHRRCPVGRRILEFFGFEVTTGGGTYEVLAADPQRNEVVVDLVAGFGTATVVVYDGNDRFHLDGRVVSLSLFESVLANELDDEASILLLGWASRDPDNQADRTDWFLVT